MSKGVLGNDPFKRGAAQTDQKPAEPSTAAASPDPSTPIAPPIRVTGKPKPPPAPAPLGARKAVPVLTPQPKPKAVAKPLPPPPPPPTKIVVPKPKTGFNTPARRAVATLSSELPRPSPKAHPGSPSMGADPVGHAASPHLSHVPEAHAGSPSIGADPVAHESSPVLKHNPRPHDGSPDLRADVTPHMGSPSVIADLRDGPAEHAGSPSLVGELDGTEPIAHAAAPQVLSDRTSAAEDAISSAHEATQGLAGPLLTAASGLFKAARSALGFGAAGPVDTWGKDETLTRSLHPVGDFLYDRYFRVTVEGAQNIPNGPSILVANHSGALPLDGPMLQYALQRERSDLAQARWLVEDQIFHAPVLGVLMNRLGAVRAHPENAVRLLSEGSSVIVFPEGFLGISKPFTQRYQLKRFGRGGYVKLAIKCGVPIVPVAIVGAEESMPLLAKLPGGAFGLPYLPLTPPPLPAKWRIRFSEAVDVQGGSETDLPFVQQQNDLVRDTIAGMLESMLKK